MWSRMLTVHSVQLISGLTFSSQEVPRMMFSFPQLMMWNRTRWMIPLMWMNMVEMNLMTPDSLSDPSTFLAWIGWGSRWYGILCFLTKSQSRQFIEALLSMRALVMTSLLKVFLRTDRVIWNDFDSLSATITLLMVSGVLCAWGELLFKNPACKV